MNGTGYMGCVIPPNTPPPGNQTGCDPYSGIWCTGNFTCFGADPENVCIENCGVCPDGMVCTELWTNGPWGCLLPDGSIPTGNPNCDMAACPGNMTCYSLSTGGTVCLDNCSVDYACDTEGATRCLGTVVQTCTSGVWVDTTDCATSSQFCHDGACVAPSGLGDFCEEIPCEAGLDCLGTATSVHQFCSPECDCATGTGCDTATGWECMFSDQHPTDPTCWCGKTCPNNDPAQDCPNGGTGWSCEETETGSGVYFCMIQ
jgi:hypothetical protein